MPGSDPHIYLPLDFDQVFELVKQLPKNEKKQLADMLLKEDDSDEIPEDQKQLVRERIKKYTQNPELLIAEEDALEKINKM